MNRTEIVTLTNMCMIYDDEGNVLIQHRTGENWPGVVFPGGHIEKGESIIESVKREVFEETGLIVDNLDNCGVKQFFRENGERYIVFLYKTKSFSGTIISSTEGVVEWIPFKKLNDMNLAKGFVDMIPLFNKEYNELIYKKGNPQWIK